jgi:hypothetical protein
MKQHGVKANGYLSYGRKNGQNATACGNTVVVYKSRVVLGNNSGDICPGVVAA